MTHPQPTPLTATAARDLIRRLVELHNLPRPLAVETTATGTVTLRLGTATDVDRWAYWLAVRVFDGPFTRFTATHSARPAVAGMALTVYGPIGA